MTISRRSGFSRIASGAAFLCALLILLPTRVDAQPSDELHLRVVDVGPGLCTVTEAPGQDRPHYMVYDAGHWTGGQCLDAVREIVGASPIDLLVISHADSDHLGDAAEILDEFEVHHMLRTGFRRTTASWRRMDQAVERERLAGGTIQSLTDDPLIPGTRIPLGNAVVTLLAGWGVWTLTEGPTDAELRNVISIVLRVDYGGRSILYTGDTVGKRLGDPDSACKDAEKFMVANDKAGVASLDADVILAPHHGGNNGSATCFIEAVSPSVVIFSAGHRHHHPTAAAAQRYLDLGISADSIFRTDRGDDESGTKQWEPTGTVRGCKDSRGDDDITVILTREGAMSVEYAEPSTGC